MNPQSFLNPSNIRISSSGKHKFSNLSGSDASAILEHINELDAQITAWSKQITATQGTINWKQSFVDSCSPCPGGMNCRQSDGQMHCEHEQIDSFINNKKDIAALKSQIVDLNNRITGASVQLKELRGQYDAAVKADPTLLKAITNSKLKTAAVYGGIAVGALAVTATIVLLYKKYRKK